jgi:hypothetical protein
MVAYLFPLSKGLGVWTIVVRMRRHQEKKMPEKWQVREQKRHEKGVLSWAPTPSQGYKICRILLKIYKNWQIWPALTLEFDRLLQLIVKFCNPFLSNVKKFIKS